MIAPLLPPTHGNQQLELRAIVNGIFYLNATGCQWRALPHEYPVWSSVYYHFAKWSGTGLLESINTALCKMDRQKRGRAQTPTGALIDSQSIKTAKEASQVGFDGGKMVKGHKRHILTDTVGNMLNVVVSAANVSDIAGGKLVIEKILDTFSTIEKIWADGTYRGELLNWVAARFRFRIEPVLRPEGQKGFQVLPRRWVVERTFAWLDANRRLSKDYEALTDTNTTMIYIAMTRLLMRRLASS